MSEVCRVMCPVRYFHVNKSLLNLVSVEFLEDNTTVSEVCRVMCPVRYFYVSKSLFNLVPGEFL